MMSVVPLIGACGGHSSHSDAAGGTPPSIDASAPYNGEDLVFVQGMIPHHAQAVEMAVLAPERASSPAVKAIAEKIRAAQDPEIAQMRGWLQQWGQPEMEKDADHSGHGMKGMMSDEQMRKLESARGADFDRMFVAMMIDHHEGAVEMSETVGTKGKNADVRTLSQQIIVTQQAEIVEMRALPIG